MQSAGLKAKPAKKEVIQSICYLVGCLSQVIRLKEFSSCGLGIRVYGKKKRQLFSIAKADE
jgi:hypothetical protein